MTGLSACMTASSSGARRQMAAGAKPVYIHEHCADFLHGNANEKRA
jgi:hypothetical protein